MKWNQPQCMDHRAEAEATWISQPVTMQLCNAWAWGTQYIYFDRCSNANITNETMPHQIGDVTQTAQLLLYTLYSGFQSSYISQRKWKLNHIYDGHGNRQSWGCYFGQLQLANQLQVTIQLVKFREHNPLQLHIALLKE